ncbi:MAG: ubiquinol-cytochrome c reductase iron-sulfur subunit [Halioglobus sp.]
MQKTEPVKQPTAEAEQRRLKLRVAIKAMVYVGVFAILYVLFSSFRNSSQGIPTVPSKIIDVSQMQMGEAMFLSWEGRPVIIYRRQDSEFSTLRTIDERLLDAKSQSSDQPGNALNAYRSVTPEWFVAIALGTDQGCSLTHVPADTTQFQQQPWQGGFIDSCRKSRYDLAGRVYESQYATRNLVVPPYGVSAETLILGQ